ncbi:MAG TPA: hypothetical protein VLM38_21205 [Blastocatellia bacterium]|nr:hypothetical protein [Blastocatellia bacterium]
MIHSRRQVRELFLSLFCIELLLAVAYGTDVWVQGDNGQPHELINLDAEGNLPTWFSSFQLALIAISFWALAARTRASQRPSRRFFRLCAGFFLLLSIDETALLHERLTASLGSRYVDWVPRYLVNHPPEAIVCLLVLVACACAAYPHLRGLLQVSIRASLIAGSGCVVYVTGAAVLETIGYKMLNAGASVGLYRFEVTLEEFLEMFGASLILYAALLFCCLAGNKARISAHTGPEKVAIDSSGLRPARR